MFISLISRGKMFQKVEPETRKLREPNKGSWCMSQRNVIASQNSQYIPILTGINVLNIIVFSYLFEFLNS